MTDDHKEFATFVDLHSRRLMGAAVLLTGNSYQAEDLVQTTMIKTFSAWKRIRTMENPEAYVRMILLNEHRKKWRRRHREQLVADPPETADPTRSAVARLDDLDQLRRALAQIPERQRQAVVLRHYLHLSEAEAAESMRCSPGTVKSQTSRALAKLRTLMREELPPSSVPSRPAGPAPTSKSDLVGESRCR